MKLTLLLRSTLSLAVNCDAGSLTELRANGSSGKLRVPWRQTLLNSTRLVVTTVKPDTCQDAGTYGYKCAEPPPPPLLPLPLLLKSNLLSRTLCTRLNPPQIRMH